MSENNNPSNAIFESVEEAEKVLSVLLKYFSPIDDGEEPGKTKIEYLISKIEFIEIEDGGDISVRADYKKSTLFINLPIALYTTKEELLKSKIDCLVSFSSMLDQMKTKTLVEIYKSLKTKAQQDLLTK